MAKASASAEDKEKREEDARNSLDGMVYNIEEVLKESSRQDAGSGKGDVESVLAESKKVGRHRVPGRAEERRTKPRRRQAWLAEVLYKTARQCGRRAPSRGEPGQAEEPKRTVR